MDIKTLQEKINELSDKTRPHYKLYSQEEKEILKKNKKINEEV